ncbi:MAG TPA: GNAT family N-acetyltransferase [Parafilimonas sp.]|nr:GNAT family N-acetyltransferase [Parafilimonas sp.]
MSLNVLRTGLQEILPLRNLFLQENNFQIRYNACHERGWADSYTILYNEEKIGYGAVKGNENIKDRDTVFEFYIIPSYRRISSVAFSKLLSASGAIFIECQSNDLLLTALLYEYGKNINSDVVLFEENTQSWLYVENVLFRKRNSDDIIFDHKAEPVGDYVLELDNEIVATGGFLLHYNMPFADLYMEVREDHRKRGFGSFLIQEIKKQCYLSGRIPAARTSINNKASWATLTKAGLKEAGFMLLGAVDYKTT